VTAGLRLTHSSLSRVTFIKRAAGLAPVRQDRS
jgi:hypothetical protein